MPRIDHIIRRWWKQMLGLVIISLAVTAVITFLKKPQYLSVATAVPASSLSTDKARIFNEHIEALYSALGTPDDLDRITGTASLDTVYLAVTDHFNLYDHYKVQEKGEAARMKSASLLKTNSRVMKSEYGELKVQVWDNDKDLAPQLANDIMTTLDHIHRDLQSAGNDSTLKRLVEARDKMVSSTSAQGNETRAVLEEYNKLIREYELMAAARPPALYIVEKARAAGSPDRPRPLQAMLITFVLSALFAFFLALLLERRKPA